MAQQKRLPSRAYVTLLLGGVFALFLLAFSGCSPTDQAAQSLNPLASSPQTDEQRSARALYNEAWQLISRDFVDPRLNGQDWSYWKNRYNSKIVTRDDAYMAINSMVSSLNDNYTHFLPPKDAQEQNMRIDARLFGVGIQVGLKDNILTVISPIEGSPAAKAGLRALDKIIEINHEPTVNMALESSVEKIRGPKGTPVTLTILRQHSKRTVTLVRDEIVLKSVFTEPLSNPEVAYIRLSSFMSQDAPQEMLAALNKQSKARALILDLRGNNGGLLSNALDIADMFLKQGAIVSVVGRAGDSKTFVSDPDQVFSGPMVLLVDEGSASASEILAGALKDNHRAVLVGSTTFGKGLVQKINTLSDGSELNLTISKYLTPAGHDIHKVGILPNISVSLTLSDFEHNRDPQKAEAIKYLTRQLAQPNTTAKL